MSEHAWTPDVISGDDGGDSVYTVVLKSKNGYVAFKKLAENLFKIRVEFFDKRVLHEKVPKSFAPVLSSCGATLKANGSRSVTYATNSDYLVRAISTFSALLLFNELNYTDVPVVPNKEGDEVLAHLGQCKRCQEKYGPQSLGSDNNDDSIDPNSDGASDDESIKQAHDKIFN